MPQGVWEGRPGSRTEEAAIRPVLQEPREKPPGHAHRAGQLRGRPEPGEAGRGGGGDEADALRKLQVAPGRAPPGHAEFDGELGGVAAQAGAEAGGGGAPAAAPRRLMRAPGARAREHARGEDEPRRGPRARPPAVRAPPAAGLRRPREVPRQGPPRDEAGPQELGDDPVSCCRMAHPGCHPAGAGHGGGRRSNAHLHRIGTRQSGAARIAFSASAF
mmetsp:Transcript_56347/g.158821  ORF Transcript_56347/g.158821 Transcript_56347/m.158821 type:complete len:217 (+) Transcript_56347:555-1205(+)